MDSARRTSQQAWIETALSEHEGPLLRYAQRLAGNAEAARDAVQETFLQLCRAERGTVDGHLVEWLFTVCRRQVFARQRKEHRMSSHDERLATLESRDPQPDVAAERRDDGRQMADWIDRLPESQQEVLRLKFQNGMSYREISRVTGHTVTNVGFLIHRGLKTLRERQAAQAS